ncbi:MAG: hypothetical protein WBE76_23850 [Terracidiphilus sp.]
MEMAGESGVAVSAAFQGWLELQKARRQTANIIGAKVTAGVIQLLFPALQGKRLALRIDETKVSWVDDLSACVGQRQPFGR